MRCSRALRPILIDSKHLRLACSVVAMGASDRLRVTDASARVPPPRRDDFVLSRGAERVSPTRAPRCMHNRAANACVVCRLAGLPIVAPGAVKKWRHVCRISTPNAWCEHAIMRQSCKTCSPHIFCIHGRHLAKSCAACERPTPFRPVAVPAPRRRRRLCMHNRRVDGCAECAKCPHRCWPTACRDCSPAAFCEHHIRKQSCIACSPHLFCSHGRRFQAACKGCGRKRPGARCRHSKWAHVCRECSPTAYCAHSKLKQSCKQCSPAKFCQHGRQLYTKCIPCGRVGPERSFANRKCAHGKWRHVCISCSPKAFCLHGRRKHVCTECETAKLTR